MVSKEGGRSTAIIGFFGFILENIPSGVEKFQNDIKLKASFIIFFFQTTLKLSSRVINSKARFSLVFINFGWSF
jgi:hypothetical protein